MQHARLRPRELPAQRRDLGRVDQAALGQALLEGLSLRRIEPVQRRGAKHVGAGGPGANGEDIDRAVYQLARQLPAVKAQCRLAHAVGHAKARKVENAAAHRCDVNHAGVLGGLQPGQQRLGQPKRTERVDPHQQLVLLARIVAQPADRGRAEAGVVDQHLHVADGLGERIDRGAVALVVGVKAHPVVAEPLAQRRHAVSGAAVGGMHEQAFAHEAFDDGQADALRAAGDQC